MPPRASFIQIGDRYYATIRSGSEEDVIQEGGKNLPFPSAVAAVSHAEKVIRDRRPKPTQAMAPKSSTPSVVAEWNRQRLERRQADRDMATLIGVEVVHKRRARRT